jgi:Helix-turn-helix domain
MLIPGEPFNPYKLFVGSFLPNWLMRRPEISQGAKLCYARLAQYAGEGGHAHPSQATLATELAVSGRQVRKYVKELIAHELLTTRQFGLAQTNAYIFLWHKWAEDGIRPGPELKFHSRRNHSSGGEERKFQSERNHGSDKENQEENHEEKSGSLAHTGEKANNGPWFCTLCNTSHATIACP